MSSLVKQGKRTGDVALALVFVPSANAKCLLGNVQLCIEPINSSNTYFQCLVHIQSANCIVLMYSALPLHIA